MGSGAGRPEKALDPQAGPTARFAAELRALRRAAGSVPYRELSARAGYSVTALSQAAAGNRLPSLPVTLAYAEACGGARTEWERRWREAEAETEAETEAASLARGADGGTPPYRGLTRFEPEDEAVFFGRERLTDDLTALVAEHRFAVVLGPSGSGKSSLLRAGLIPRLRRSAPPLPPAAALRVLTPGEHPMRNRAPVLTPAAKDGETWLIVDQFEEVFTLCADPGEREEFLASLLAARDPGSRIRVVLGVRADFYANCLAHPALAEAARAATLPVGPLTAEEMRGAIVRPAAAAGLTVERVLTARLVDEVTREPGSLPLLSHALLETWRRRRGRTLTLAGHEAAGGLRGALAQTAEEVYAELGPDRAPVARRLLLNLITPGDGAPNDGAPGDGTPDTRRPVPRDTLVPPDSPEAAEAGAVLDRLARARLVTLDQDVVDLAHEALITAWPRLSGWIDTDRERLRRHRRLTQATENWLTRRRDAGALLRGGELAEAEATFAEDAAAADASRSAELVPAEREFLRAGLASRARTRRIRRGVTTFVGLLLVLLTVASTTAWQQGRDNVRQRVDAEIRRAKGEELAAGQLAAVAQGLRSSDPALAMRLSVAAWRVAETAETRSALLAASVQAESDAYDVPDEAGPWTSHPALPVRLSADGRVAVTVDADSVRAWDVRKRTAIGPETAFDRATLFRGISPDGRTALVQGGEEKAGPGDGVGARRLDLASGTALDAAPRPAGASIAWTAAEQIVANMDMAAATGRLSLRDARSGRTLLEVPTGRYPMWALSPDGRHLALCARGGDAASAFERGDVPLRVWDVTRGTELPATRSGGCAVDSFRFTGDGAVLMSQAPGGLSLWDPITDTEPARIDQPGLTEATTSPDGRFAAAVDGREILMWRLAAPERPVFRYSLTNGAASQLRIDPKDGVIRYLTERRLGDTMVRTISYGPATTPDWNPEPASTGTFSADGTTVAVDRRKGDSTWFEAYTVADGRRTARTPPADCPKAAPASTEPLTRTPAEPACRVLLALTPDGHTLAHARTGLAEGPEAGDGDGGGDPAERRDIAEEPALWDIPANTARPLPADPKPSPADRMPITGMAVSPDGRSLLTTRAGVDTLDVRDLTSGRRTRPQDLTRDRTSSVAGLRSSRSAPVAVRPDGRLLATSSTTFDIPTGRRTERGLAMERGGVLAYSPDGTRLAVGDTTGGVTLWDGQAERRLATLPAGSDAVGPDSVKAVTALAFSPDGQTLAVAGAGGTLRLWDVNSGRPLGSPLPTPGDGIVAVAFSPDGHTLHSAGEHSTVRTHQVAPSGLAESVCGRAGTGLSRSDWRTYLPDLPYRKTC
ncbi:DNA-binding protein [Streptomyces sp. NBC_01264]|uniref:nSTAND1 domain-containing NTPase n=1 Tax=Streptomyces sp. NBC_01264 TaxID=2903804 RepID=UPI00225BFB5F|nr:DNA-binding protein [Streptomyces sp. NBC_01264]MCX4781891.1 DNA-binding protein [Streptomyces sp. NBC_01264]